MKHTKGEWKIVKNGRGEAILMRAVGIDANIAIFRETIYDNDPISMPEREANARWACQCVNSHDALIETIKNALTSLAIISMPVVDNSVNVATDKELLKIMADSFQEAIAQAEGK